MEIYKEDVYEIISNVLECEVNLIKQMNPDDDLAVCGMDSVSVIRLIVLLEERYDIEFQEDDIYIGKINTLNKIFELLKKY